MKEEYGGETTFQKKFEQRADGIEIKGIPSSLVKMSECPEKIFAGRGVWRLMILKVC